MENFDDRLEQIRYEVAAYISDTKHAAHEFSRVQNAFGDVLLMLRGLACLSDEWSREKYPREKKIRELMTTLEKDIRAAITPENDYAEELEKLSEYVRSLYEHNSDIGSLSMSLVRTRQFLVDFIARDFIEKTLLYRYSKELSREDFEKQL